MKFFKKNKKEIQSTQLLETKSNSPITEVDDNYLMGYVTVDSIKKHIIDLIEDVPISPNGIDVPIKSIKDGVII